MAQSCGICTENMNKSKRLAVTCPYCSYKACRECCITYMMGQTIAKCMNGGCGKEWTRKFLVHAFTKSFVAGAWKTHKEKVLLDRELALLPATQSLVETEIRNEIVKAEIDDLGKMINELTERRKNLRLTIRLGGDVIVPSASKFVRACPSNECRGFLSTQWKCGLCELYTCPDCHAVKGKERDNSTHVCNVDEVATAKLLSNDTKPCPKCATGIFKISGCDQMWCTQCHTAFSWKSGQIETRIHNPHYYEWQRINGGGVAPRVAGDVLCGQEISVRLLNKFNTMVHMKASRPFTLKISKMYSNISNIIRDLIHLREVDVRHIGYVENQTQNNQELRIKYMRNKIDKKTFQKYIHRDNKKHEKKREIHEVAQMFIQTVTDIMYRAKECIKKLVKLDDTVMGEVDIVFKEIDTITSYTNECLREIADIYNSTPMHIVLNQADNAFIGYGVLMTVKAKSCGEELMRRD